MFPQNNLREQIENFQNSQTEKKTQLGVTTSLNPETNIVELENGTPKMITDIDAIEKWITLFISTPRDVYPIYAGTNFGTNWKKLLGQKYLNNGYSISELEREIREGLPLCPAIQSVQSVTMEKIGTFLNIYITVELYDGELHKFIIKKAYTLK